MKKLFFGALFIVGISTTVNANLISNGDFETGDLTGWEYTYNDVTVVDTGSSNGYAALLGENVKTGVSGLAQDFYIPPTLSYISVEFDYLFEGTDNSWFSDDGFLSGLVTLEGTSASGYSLELLVSDASTSSSFGTVVHYSGIFDISGIADIDPNAAIGFGLIEFSSGWWDRTNTNVYIDNVSVSSVSEPSILALFGLSLVGMGIARRKFK